MTLIVGLTSLMFLTAPGDPAPSAPAPTTEKEVRYQKDQMVDLSGSQVEGENQTPPAFFVTKVNTPGAKGMLPERLNFSLRKLNETGF